MVDLEFSLVATELWKILRLIEDFGSWLGNSVYSLRRCREREGLIQVESTEKK